MRHLCHIFFIYDETFSFRINQELRKQSKDMDLVANIRNDWKGYGICQE